jgi:NitT/TauT family transport system substrate-binding protein
VITRRAFLKTTGAVGAIALSAGSVRPVRAQDHPEITKLTLVNTTSLCAAPQYIAEELLRGEGFDGVRHLRLPGGPEVYRVLSTGQADIAMAFAAPFLLQVDAGDPTVMLAGVHPGCFELFGNDRVRTIKDLKGKTVAVLGVGGMQHLFVSVMASYVGLDPRRDISFVTHTTADSMRLLGEGKIDAYLGFPPDPQEMRAKKIGHVVVNSAVDRPWSQYFCCIIAGNREFVRRHPVATKRALRAILKSADVCALEPARAARLVVDRGLVERYDYAFETIRGLPFAMWREYDPEDTVRFYALRLHEAGMVKSNPQKLIAQGTDWRFLNALKKELKG